MSELDIAKEVELSKLSEGFTESEKKKFRLILSDCEYYMFENCHVIDEGIRKIFPRLAREVFLVTKKMVSPRLLHVCISMTRNQLNLFEESYYDLLPEHENRFLRNAVICYLKETNERF